MTTHAHLHIANYKDGIYLLTNADGTNEFIHKKINETDNEIKSTIECLRESISKTIEKSTNLEMRKRWLLSLQEFHEKPQSLTKIATLAMWGNIHNFFPMTHMALSLKRTNSEYKLPAMDYCVFQDKKNTKVNQILTLNNINQMNGLSNLIDGLLNKFTNNLRNIDKYSENKIPNDYLLIQIIDSDEYRHISDGKINSFNSLKHTSGRFVKFKEQNLEKLTQIITTLPLQFSCLFDVWSFSLNENITYKEGKSIPEKVLAKLKRSIERFSNIDFNSVDPKIDDSLQYKKFNRMSPILTSGYKFINFLLIFYPDLFEEVTFGESTYILNHKPDVAMKIMVNSDTEEVNICIPGETTVSQEQMFNKLNQEYKKTFVSICEDWGISPEICEKKREGDVSVLPVSTETYFFHINQNYQSISFNMIDSIYNIVRMYDKSLLNKKLRKPT